MQHFYLNQYIGYRYRQQPR